MNQTSFNPDNYWENRLHTLGGLEGVGFKKLGPSFNKWAYRIRKQVFLKTARSLAVDYSAANVLDIGSGTGFYIQAWGELGAPSITGVDITATAVENLKTVFPKQHFFKSDIGDVAFNSAGEYSKYNLVSAMDVLFHIVDDARFEQAIQNIASLVEPGGYFFYSDNYLHGPTRRGESQVNRSKDYLDKVFSANGFEQVVRKPFMYLTNSPIDSSNPVLKSYWFLLENTLYVAPFLGHVAGPLLYPFEMMAVGMAAESPTTELAVYRKKA